MDDSGVVGGDGACDVAGQALTGPLPAMRRRFPERHVGGRDARDTAGRNAHRSEIECSPSQQLSVTHTQRLVVVTAALFAFARASDADGVPMRPGDDLATTWDEKPRSSRGGRRTTVQHTRVVHQQAVLSRAG